MLVRFKILCLCLLLAGCVSERKDEHFNGYFEGDYRYLAPTISARIVKINVKEGERVNLGDMLFRLEDTVQSANLAAALANLKSLESNLADISTGKRPEEIEQIKAQLEQAKSAFWIAQTNLKRAKSLRLKNAIADKDFDNAKAEFDRTKALVSQLEATLKVANLPARSEQIKSIKANIEAAKAKIDESKWSLEQTTLKAPLEGLVETIFYKEGEIVSSSTPVLSLLPTNEIKAIFFVPASKLPEFSVGKRVKISCERCPETLATISKIASKPEYAPPIIYSQNSQSTLVFRVEAMPETGKDFMHPSLPITVRLVR